MIHRQDNSETTADSDYLLGEVNITHLCLHVFRVINQSYLTICKDFDLLCHTV